MKKDSQESIKRKISHYTAKHQELDEELIVERRKRIPDTVRVGRIKKLKLMCKDKLTTLGERLTAKQKPPKPSAEVIPLQIPQPILTEAPARRAASG